MTSPLNALGPVTPLQWPTSLPAVAPTDQGTPFAELLSAAWNDTRTMQNDAQSAIQSSLAGNDLTMVETFTAVREADIALKLMMQIRNKLVDAYQELQQLRF